MKVLSECRTRNPSSFKNSVTKQAFTLVEMLVSIAVLLLIMTVIFAMTSQAGKIWKSTTGKIGAFEEARVAFEAMTRTISQATLNTYYDYTYDANGNPVSYVRQTQLHFICGPAASLIPTTINTWSGQTATVSSRPTHAIFFQAPLGYDTTANNLNISLSRLLNAAGFYIEFNNDNSLHPTFLSSYTSKYRYRLMEISQSSNYLLVYKSPFYLASRGWAGPAGSQGYNGWFNGTIANFKGPIPQGLVRPLANNIIALLIQPKLSPSDSIAVGATTISNLSPDYCYDSRTTVATSSPLYTALTPTTTSNLHINQLPPLVQVTMVAIDEASAIRLAAQNGTAPPSLVSPTAFKNSSQFSSGNPSTPQDLETLQASLAQQHINYKTFSTTVSIRGAKWSSN